LGRKAAVKVVQMMREKVAWLNAKDFIALSNAGYAEVNGETTMGALDGLSETLGVRRGDNSLVEVHSAAEKALWFAIYHQRSGYCVYLQVDPEALYSGFFWGRRNRQSLFSIAVMEQINANHLFDNADEYTEKFNNQIFGGNEFRIVTICNAVAEGAPSYAVRSFEFHDHYCPGVTSGIMMAQYVKSFFPLYSGGSYFVQGVKPACKEDALVVMLNTTPGKSGYSVTYPTDEDIAKWPTWAKTARNIIYWKETSDSPWVALVLEYNGGDTGCPSYSSSILSKLCSDLWYLGHLDEPEEFVNVLKEIELPAGATPKDYARPGVDAILLLDDLVSEP
jgi:formylmethanofuran dehydrogenase subunit E-like metal-binding protein